MMVGIRCALKVPDKRGQIGFPIKTVVVLRVQEYAGASKIKIDVINIKLLME